jgi:hypothetical protein
MVVKQCKRQQNGRTPSVLPACHHPLLKSAVRHLRTRRLTSVIAIGPMLLQIRMRSRLPRLLFKRIAMLMLAVLLLAVGVFTAGVLWPQPTLEVPPAQTLAIEGVRVVDVRAGRLLGERTVVIADGRIVAMDATNAIKLPAGARRIDGHGRYLTPALWDMHTHITRASPMLDMPLYVAYGVTQVRDMMGCPRADDPFLVCEDEKRAWDTQIAQGERIGPRIRGIASFMANGPVSVRRMPELPTYFAVSTPEQARAFVRHHVGRVSAIKVYDHIPRDAYFALADEARQHGLDLVGHRPHAVSAIEAAMHQKSLEHARFLLHESFPGAAALRARANTPAWHEDRQQMLDQHDPAMANEIFAAMRRHGTWYVPTHLTRWADAGADQPQVREDPLLRYLHPLLQRQWREDLDELLVEDPSPSARQAYRAFYRKGLALTAQAHRAGVRVLVGTDYIAAGADVHREMQQLVMAGLTPADALRAATLSPAEYFEVENAYGTVDVGKHADVLLLDADPLREIGNSQRLHAVIQAGRYYDGAALERIRAHVEDQARSFPVACRLIWGFLRNPTGY